MARYRELLADQHGFVVPQLHSGLTTGRILAMSFEGGSSIEELASEPPERRDAVFARLLRLVARELFELGVMQTDPNFANYRFRKDTGEIVLLDFGACRAVDPNVANNYRAMLDAGLAADRERAIETAICAGFMHARVAEKYPERTRRMFDIVIGEMGRDAPFDFGDRAFVPLLREEGMAIAKDRETWIIPPIETLFVQRKVSGTALLGARLGAVVNVREIVEEVLGATEPFPE